MEKIKIKLPRSGRLTKRDGSIQIRLDAHAYMKLADMSKISGLSITKIATMIVERVEAEYFDVNDD